MSLKIGFTEGFIAALDNLKTDTNRALIYAAHVVNSEKISSEHRDHFAAEIARLSTDMRNTIQRFDLKGLTDFNLREAEEGFIAGAGAVHKSFQKLFDTVERKFGLALDPKAAFSLMDVTKELKEKAYKKEYLITADKIDNLLSIKKLIIQIYEDQTRHTVEKEKNQDRAFQELKEKTFLQLLRNPSNRSPLFFFKSLQLLKKCVADGKPVSLRPSIDPTCLEVIQMACPNRPEIECYYRGSGFSIAAHILKRSGHYGLRYTLEGSIEKGGDKLEYHLEEQVLFEKEIVFERVSGLEAILEQFEKAMLEERESEATRSRAGEAAKAAALDKAIDDFLFG